MTSMNVFDTPIECQGLWCEGLSPCKKTLCRVILCKGKCFPFIWVINLSVSVNVNYLQLHMIYMLCTKKDM
jgi:hypothetical protein